MTGNKKQTAVSAPAQLRVGAIVLAGGGSERMGMDKAQLLFNDVSFLECILNTVAKVTDKSVVVGSPSETYDYISGDLFNDVQFLSDEHPDSGPIEGIRTGLAALEDDVDVAFVTSCDVPLLNADIVPLLVSELGEFEAVVPCGQKRVYGMTAIYRTSLHPRIADMIERGKLRVAELADEFNTNRLPVTKIREVDPDLHSMTNINFADEYRELLVMHNQEMRRNVYRRLKW